METTRTAGLDWSDSTVMSRFLQGLRKVMHRIRIQRRERSLRVNETLALGEKRSLLVVEFESRRYLIGATAQSISLLERLDGFGREDVRTAGASSLADRGLISPLPQ